MFSKIKRKISSTEDYKGKEEQSYDIDAFSFGLYEECALQINIIKKNHYKDMFDVHIPFSVPDYLKHLELGEFSYDEISIFRPTNHPDLPKSQLHVLNLPSITSNLRSKL